MEYKICKLQFSTGLHIGKGMLTDGEPIFMADTFFSALCHEALGISEGIEKLVHYCKSGKLKLSDGLPYIDDTLYVPKPLTTVETKEEGNSKVKKAFKNLSGYTIKATEKAILEQLEMQKKYLLQQMFV